MTSSNKIKVCEIITKISELVFEETNKKNLEIFDNILDKLKELEG